MKECKKMSKKIYLFLADGFEEIEALGVVDVLKRAELQVVTVGVNEKSTQLDAHNIKVDYLGAYATVALHIELDGKMTLDESHEIVHKVQNYIIKEIPEVKYVMVHACPIGSNYDHSQKIDK